MAEVDTDAVLLAELAAEIGGGTVEEMVARFAGLGADAAAGMVDMWAAEQGRGIRTNWPIAPGTDRVTARLRALLRAVLEHEARGAA